MGFASCGECGAHMIVHCWMIFAESGAMFDDGIETWRKIHIVSGVYNSQCNRICATRNSFLNFDVDHIRVRPLGPDPL